VPADERDVALVEPGKLVGVVESVDDLVTGAKHGLDVERADDRLSRAWEAPSLGENLRRAEETLRRHARVVRALPADQVAFDEDDREARLSQLAGADLARGSAAHHDHVEPLLAHVTVRCAACSERFGTNPVARVRTTQRVPESASRGNERPRPCIKLPG
jgi:hypothetical protein